MPAGFASGADLGREGDVAALRDALAELSRARATCASSLARGLDAPDLRARARERAAWTTLVASNAPAPPTSTARGDASGAAPPPDDPDLAPDGALGRDDASTRSPSGAPAPANARESPQPTPMCTQPPPPASHADDAEGDDVVAATPDADLGRSDDATKGGTSRSTSVGSKRRRPASADARSADRRETRSASARRLAERPSSSLERPSPSLDASLDAPESAYRRLASSQLRGAYSLDESDEFAAAKRVAAEPTLPTTTEVDADLDESAPTPAATLPRSALTVPRSALTTAPPKTIRVSSSGKKSKPSARDETLPDSVATRVEETPAADARTRCGGGGRRIRFSVGATGQTHALDDAVDDVATARDEAREGVALAADSPASSTTCVLRVKFEASSVRGVTVSRDVSNGGANVAVVARRDVSDGEVAEVLAWRVAAPPSRATLLGSVRFRLRDGDDAEIRNDAIVASPTSAAALFRARAGSSPSRPTVAFDADAVATSPNGEWLAIPATYFPDAETVDGVCVCRVAAPEHPSSAARPLVDIASAMNAEGAEDAEGAEGRGRDGGVGFGSPETWRTSSRMDGASSAKSRTRRRSSARLDPNATRRRTVALACSFPVTRVVASPDGSWLVGFGAEGRARAWRVGDEPAWTGVSQGTRAETPRNDDSDDSTPNPAFSRATRRGVAIPAPTFSEERIAPRGDAPNAACFSPEGDALVGVFDGGMRATWRVPVGPRGHTWTLRKVTFDADRDVLALAVVDGGGVGKKSDSRAARPTLAAALTRARTNHQNASNASNVSNVSNVSVVAGVIAEDGRVVLGGDLGVSNPTAACAATATVVVVGAEDGTVRAWSLETGRAAGDPGDLRGAAVTHASGCGLAGGREGFFAAATKDGRVACYRVVAEKTSPRDNDVGR